MKKILTAILAVIMVLGLTVPSFAVWGGAPAVNLTAVRSGDEITVKISVGSATALSAFNYRLKYPGDKVSPKSTKDQIAKDASFFYSATGQSATVKVDTADMFVGYAFAYEDNISVPANTAVSTVVFTVKTGATGEIKFELTELSCGAKEYGSSNYGAPFPSAVVSTADMPKVTLCTAKPDAPFATVDFEDGGKTAVVSGDRACAVLAKTGEDTYTVLKATERTTGVYTYDLSGIAGEFELVVALRGDANMDGTLNSVDLTQARAIAKGKLTADHLKFAIVDVRPDGVFNSVDLTQIRAMFKGKLELSW